LARVLKKIHQGTNCAVAFANIYEQQFPLPRYRGLPKCCFSDPNCIPTCFVWAVKWRSHTSWTVNRIFQPMSRLDKCLVVLRDYAGQ